MNSNDKAPQDSKALVEIRDLLGISKPGELLVEAITRGVGKFIAPWQSRRDAMADIEIAELWDKQAHKQGLRANSAELTLENRANVRWSTDNTLHQYNREAIAHSAAQDFLSLPDCSTENVRSDTVVDIEWLDRFWRLAEHVSNADLQSLWGRVLSRKTTGTSQVSARTLEFLSTLSRDEATRLERLATFTYRISRTDGSSDIGIMTNMERVGHASLISDDELKQLSEKIRKIISPLDQDHYGSIGIFIESGWAHSVSQHIEGEQLALTICNVNARIVAKENALRLGHYDIRDGLRIGSGTGISPLGREVFDLIEAQPDNSYIDVLKAMTRAYGNELLMGND